MDFFKFGTSEEPTLLERGELINNIEKSMWVERYDTPGEFSFEARLNSGIREKLPLGTLLSHVDTLEVMIVENHEITETIEEDPSVVVTGRSFVSYLENRVVGMNAARGSSLITPYVLSANYIDQQLVLMINDHIADAVEPDDALSYIDSSSEVTVETGESIERTIERGTVWERVEELLKADELGIKTIRRNAFFGGTITSYTDIVIYRGEDRSKDVMFSWKSGELDSANYLFTQKNEKNSAVVFGQYVCVVVDTGPANYAKRMMIIDATDIDGNFGSVPTGGDIFNIATQLATRGLQTLATQNQINISQADVSKTTKYQYRRDYNVGDLVTLDGNFNQTQIMRVVEYAEIEDENGESGHPTLALPGG